MRAKVYSLSLVHADVEDRHKSIADRVFPTDIIVTYYSLLVKLSDFRYTNSMMTDHVTKHLQGMVS